MFFPLRRLLPALTGAALMLAAGTGASPVFAQNGFSVFYSYNNGNSFASGTNDGNPNDPVIVNGDDPVELPPPPPPFLLAPGSPTTLAGTIQSDPIIINNFSLLNTSASDSYDSILFTLLGPQDLDPAYTGPGTNIRFTTFNGQPGIASGDLNQFQLINDKTLRLFSSNGQTLDPGEITFVQFYIDAPSPGPTGSSYRFNVVLTPNIPDGVIPEPATGLLALAGALPAASLWIRRKHRRG